MGSYVKQDSQEGFTEKVALGQRPEEMRAFVGEEQAR